MGRARGWGGLVIALAGALLLAMGALAVLTLVGSAVKNSCLRDGPGSPDALISESGDTVDSRLSWWPLGRECEWMRADGDGTVTTHAGNVLSTAATYGAVAVGAAGMIAGARIRRSAG